MNPQPRTDDAGDQVAALDRAVHAGTREARHAQRPPPTGNAARPHRARPQGVLCEIGETLIGRGELLHAADHIRYALVQENNVDGYLQAIRAAVDGPPGDKYRPSVLFEVLLSLDPRIVFTTNYDKLFETASLNGFATHTFSSDGLSNDLRRGEPVLVKIHGTTNLINEIILTRTDYVRVMRTGRDVFDALSALSLTSTILFVGYSLDDPDIQLVLQAVGRPG
jgi:SIR2-like protein